jgi:hypothetical protein
MSDTLAKDLIGRCDRLKGKRGTRENEWQDLAELGRPMRAEFNRIVTAGTSRTGRIFDSTAGLANENLGAGLYGMMSSPSNEWFGLASEIAELNEDHDVAEWTDHAAATMRTALAARGNRFYTRSIDLYSDLPMFGTGIFYSEQLAARGAFYFSTRHLAECYLAQNREEEIDTNHRRFQWTARQAKQQWPDLGGEIARAAQNEPEREFQFQHSVLPAAEIDAKLPGGRRWASVYIDLQSRTVLNDWRRDGYFEFPYQCPRWATLTRDTYGDSPAMLVQPDVRMINQMSKTTLMAAQMAVAPPILVADEGVMRGIRATPGQPIYGGIDPATGRRLVDPLVTNPDVRLGLEMEEQRRKAIRDGFYGSLLLMVQQPNMTATEFLGRQEEKLRLMGPHLGRIETEFLDLFIDRLFMMMWRAGAFRPPPPILLRYPGLKVVYTSPLARAQRAGEATAILRSIEGTKAVAEFDREALDNIDTDEAVRGIVAGFGAPQKMLRDPRLVEQRRQQRRQMEMAAALAEPADKGAGALKKATEAVAMAQDIRARAA